MNAKLICDVPLPIVRPDQHIVWQGQQLPADASKLLDLLTGRGS